MAVIRERLAGIGLILAGLALLAAVWGSTILFRARMPVILGIFGLIALGVGGIDTYTDVCQNV